MQYVTLSCREETISVNYTTISWDAVLQLFERNAPNDSRYGKSRPADSITTPAPPHLFCLLEFCVKIFWNLTPYIVAEMKEHSASVFRVELEVTWNSYCAGQRRVSDLAKMSALRYAGFCSTLMMETTLLSETQVNIDHFTWRHMPCIVLAEIPLNLARYVYSALCTTAVSTNAILQSCTTAVSTNATLQPTQLPSALMLYCSLAQLPSALTQHCSPHNCRQH
jgi:hypothetical protein